MKQATEEIAELKKQNTNFQKQVEAEKRETASLKQQVEFLLASNAPTESKLKDTTDKLEATAAKLATKEVCCLIFSLLFLRGLSEGPILLVLGPLVPLPTFFLVRISFVSPSTIYFTFYLCILQAYVTQLEASVSAGKEASLNYDKVVRDCTRLRTELSNRSVCFILFFYLFFCHFFSRIFINTQLQKCSVYRVSEEHKGPTSNDRGTQNSSWKLNCK